MNVGAEPTSVTAPADSLPNIERTRETQLAAWPVISSLLFDIADRDPSEMLIGGPDLDRGLSRFQSGFAGISPLLEFGSWTFLGACDLELGTLPVPSPRPQRLRG
jgi:hypothetical protein